MKASRTDDSRRIDWSAVKGTEGERVAKLEAQIVRFIGGIRGPRKTDVTKAQIVRWFHGTPEEFVGRALHEAVANDKVRVSRNGLRNGRRTPGYVYELNVRTRRETRIVRVPGGATYTKLLIVRVENGNVWTYNIAAERAGKSEWCWRGGTFPRPISHHRAKILAMAHRSPYLRQGVRYGEPLEPQ